MNTDALWEDVLKLKEAVAGVIRNDASRYRAKKEGDAQADIEDYTMMMLIWAADYAARHENRRPVTDELLGRFINYGAYLQRQAAAMNLRMSPYTPEMTRLLYAEFAETLERTLPIRNQCGFAFFQHTIGELGFLQTLRNSSHGARYRGMIENSINFFIKWHFGRGAAKLAEN